MVLCKCNHVLYMHIYKQDSIAFLTLPPCVSDLAQLCTYIIMMLGKYLLSFCLRCVYALLSVQCTLNTLIHCFGLAVHVFRVNSVLSSSEIQYVGGLMAAYSASGKAGKLSKHRHQNRPTHVRDILILCGIITLASFIESFHFAWFRQGIDLKIQDFPNRYE